MGELHRAEVYCTVVWQVGEFRVEGRHGTMMQMLPAVVTPRSDDASHFREAADK